jgi:hypothetical protein
MTRLSPSIALGCLALALSACSEGARSLANDRVPSRNAQEPKQTDNARTAPYLPRAASEAPEQIPAVVVVADKLNVSPIVVAHTWDSGEPGIPYVSKQLDWPSVAVAPSRRWTLRIVTTSIPHRIVYYRYPRLGPDGIPNEGDGQEEYCRFREPNASCSYDLSDAGSAISISTQHQDIGEYTVIQAAWWRRPIASRSSDLEVSVSWAFSTTRDRAGG